MNYKDLTDEQYKVVFSNSKLILCSACPGAGKSTTLAARAYRLSVDHEERVLCVTFSNKASLDLDSKVTSFNKSNLVQVKTIHKFSLDLVKRHWGLIRSLKGSENFPDNPIILDYESEKEYFSEFNSNSGLLDKIVKARELDLTPSQLSYYSRKGLYFGLMSDSQLDIWRAYETKRISEGRIVFSDMINLATQLMSFPEVSARLIQELDHILIDEAQDTSSSQWNLLRPIIAKCTSSLLVFDTNQSIYGWNGGDPLTIKELGTLVNVVKYSLTKSFRSSQKVASLANSIIKDPLSVINPVSVSSGEVTVRKFESVEEEALHVASLLQPGDCVISRNNDYLEPIEALLISRNHKYTGKSFFKQSHVLDLCSLLADLNEENAIKFLNSYISDKNIRHSKHKSDYLKVFSIVKQQGLQSLIDTSYKSQDLEDPNGVTLLTGHSSKGLEWSRVFFIGASQGIIPSKMCNDYVEEQNLFYVICTRAKEELNISYVNSPSVFLPKEFL